MIRLRHEAATSSFTVECDGCAREMRQRTGQPPEGYKVLVIGVSEVSLCAPRCWPALVELAAADLAGAAERQGRLVEVP